MLFIVPVPPEGGEPKPKQDKPLTPESWAELAREEGAEIRRGRGQRINKLIIPHADWRFLLDTYSQGEGGVYTRLRTRMHTRAPFRMRFFRENALLRFARRFGMQDVTVPNPELDRAFVVQTDSESIIRSLALDRVFSAALLALPKSRLEVVPVRRRGRRIKDAAELRWAMSGHVRDRADLDTALILLRVTVDGLVRLGVARGPLDWP